MFPNKLRGTSMFRIAMLFLNKKRRPFTSHPFQTTRTFSPCLLDCFPKRAVEMVVRSPCPSAGTKQARVRGSIPMAASRLMATAQGWEIKYISESGYSAEKKKGEISPCCEDFGWFSPPGCWEIGFQISFDCLINYCISMLPTLGKRDVGSGSKRSILKQPADSAFVTVSRTCHRQHNVPFASVLLAGSSSCSRSPPLWEGGKRCSPGNGLSWLRRGSWGLLGA